MQAKVQALREAHFAFLITVGHEEDAVEGFFDPWLLKSGGVASVQFETAQETRDVAMQAGFLAFCFAGLDPVVPLRLEVEVSSVVADDSARSSSCVHALRDSSDSRRRIPRSFRIAVTAA